jgi:hypothetical protein
VRRPAAATAMTSGMAFSFTGPLLSTRRSCLTLL